MIYIKSNEYNITNNYNDKVKMTQATHSVMNTYLLLNRKNYRLYTSHRWTVETHCALNIYIKGHEML